MKVRVATGKRPQGIPDARVAVAWGVTDAGAGQVTANVSAEDDYGIPTVVLCLRMSSAEARAVAGRLLQEAENADAEVVARAKAVRP